MEPNGNAETTRDANAQVIKKWLDYVKSFGPNEIPADGCKYICDTLSNSRSSVGFHENIATDRIVQVDEYFHGKTGGEKEWKIRFTIDADVPPEHSSQKPHIGYTVELSPVTGNHRRFNGHIFLPSGVLPMGRPSTQEYMDDHTNGEDHRDFGQKGHASWRRVYQKKRK
ncbi:unnamed protein product [Didymodactylos carnosus]|uniref:Uncharacterized protein n=1 Tax=Didymodactylos carnosus TaxID=1234261 RepID=A0A816DAN9_9BILA|nr:unnamed protein product [Didymodactylos carnosus]CAF4535863.1 unnamed protein product [Didymodactylos carnosus]